MDNNPTQHQSKNHWKVVAIVLIVVVLILAGATIFFAIKSYGTWNSNVEAGTCLNDDILTECPKTPMVSSNQDYLVIEEWGVKFAIPYGLKDVTYDIYTLSGEYSGIMDAKLYATFDDEYVTPPEGDRNEPLAFIRRYGPEGGVPGPGLPGTHAEGIFTINDYTYVLWHGFGQGETDVDYKAFILLWSALHSLTVAN